MKVYLAGTSATVYDLMVRYQSSAQAMAAFKFSPGNEPLVRSYIMFHGTQL